MKSCKEQNVQRYYKCRIQNPLDRIDLHPASASRKLCAQRMDTGAYSIHQNQHDFIVQFPHRIKNQRKQSEKTSSCKKHKNP